MSGSVAGAAPANDRSGNKLVVAGLACCALTLVLPPLGFVAIVIGIVLLVRGRVAPGVTILVLGFVLPAIGAVIVQAFIAKPYRIPSAL